MPDRGFSAAMLTQLSAESVKICYLVAMEFDSGDIFLTDYHRDITYSGDIYLATYGLLGFDGLEETSDLLINEVTVSLSGVDTTKALTKVLGNDYIDRAMRIYLAFIDANGDLVLDPEKLFEGTMDAPTIDENLDAGTCTVTMQGVPIWADRGRRPGRHTNDAEQKFFFPGDDGFEFVTEMPKKIRWGRS